MGSFVTIVKKEVLDALRDGKSMATVLLFPIIMACVTFATTHFLVSMQKGSSEITLAVDGQEAIAPLLARLREAGVKIVAPPENAEQAVKERQYHMALIVPDDFAEKFRRQRTASLDLLSDHSRTESHLKVARVKAIINQWSASTGALRLLTRNVSPDIASPVAINDINITSNERLAMRMLAGLPMIIMMIAFGSGIGMISEMTSGERERRSLEPLLINPVSHTCVFLGKWAATIGVTLVVTVIGVALQFIGINHAPLAELGLRLDMGVDKYFVILIILVPVTFFAVALQLFISFFARSFKDSQSYNSLIIMLPMAPGLYLTFNSGSAEAWQMLVPILGPTALIGDIVGGDGINRVYLLLCSIVSIVWALLCAVAGVHLLKREKTLFG